jgi:hypothetical protein
MSLSTTDSTAGFLIVARCCNGEEFLNVDERFLAVDLHEAHPVCARDFRGVSTSNSSISLSETSSDSIFDFLIVPLGFDIEEFLDVEERFLAVDFGSSSWVCTWGLQGVYAFDI